MTKSHMLLQPNARRGKRQLRAARRAGNRP
jgi:hypothetical protein